MASLKKRRRNILMASSEKRRCKRRALDTLLPNFASPEGINQSALKNLYIILVELSSNEEWKIRCHEFDLKTCDEGVELDFVDICDLSNVLFQQLDERFEQLFSELSAVSAAKDLGESGSNLDLFNEVEVLNLLFRCCILLLSVLLAAQSNLILEKGPILLKVVTKLMLPNLTKKHAFVFKESVFHEDNGCSTCSVEGFVASREFSEPCNRLLFLKCTMLEVFVDELLVHKQVARYLEAINSVDATNSGHGDLDILMEAICSHFIQSFSKKHASGDFLSRLFSRSFRPPALGFTAAVSLFLNPIMASAPKYMQAHLTSLVSEVIQIKNLKPDRILTNHFLSTFEKSVILYTRHMSFSASSSLHEVVYPPLESFISPDTKEKVDTLVSRFDTSSNEFLDGSFSKTKSDLIDKSLRFVKDWLNAYTMSCQDEMLTVLSCLVLKASESYDEKSIRTIEASTLQHLYLVTPLLKVMSISLLQAIRCVRLQHSDDPSCPRNMKDFSSCKEYDFILGTIACFKDSDISSPLQQDLYALMSSHSTRHMDSKSMFLHFSGLMSLGFATGLDCLVKASLLTILALLNLFVFEDGNLDVLQSLVDCSGVCLLSESSGVIFPETMSYQRSSTVGASRFHTIRFLYSSVRVLWKTNIMKLRRWLF